MRVVLVFVLVIQVVAGIAGDCRPEEQLGARMRSVRRFCSE